MTEALHSSAHQSGASDSGARNSGRFHMVRLRPDLRRLTALAVDRKLLPAQSDDLSYAAHVFLAETFGPGVLQPFRLQEGAGGRAPLLYGYSARDAEALAELAQLYGDPAVLAALGLTTHPADSKAMPTSFTAGQRLGFELRARPVVRSRRTPDGAGTRERDAFLAALPAERPGAGAGPGVSRAEVYRSWLTARLGKAARLSERQLADGRRIPWAELSSMRRSRVLRRSQPDGDGGRIPRTVEGPDVVFRGLLEVVEPENFRQLLRQGVGRHRAFGFGMLLLRPPPAE